MNSKKSLSVLLAAIGLLVSLQSCATNKTQLVERGNAAVTKRENPAPKASPKTSEKSITELTHKKSDYWTDRAKFLAGMKVKDTRAIAQVSNNSFWHKHATSFDKAWARLEAQQLSKVRKWAGTELKPINQTSRPIFYPFSGPDFLYAYSFFPNASDYLLVGLEPVGKLPQIEKLSASQTQTKLHEVSSSLDAILGFSFFRTNAMKVDLAKQGVLPILFVFLARTNNRILDVQYIGLDQNANIHKLDKTNQNKDLMPGIKISFTRQGKSQPQTLYYFSTDLSDSGLKKTPQFTKFVKKFDRPVTYLKAASYLMHNQNFSTIRNLILAQSSSLLQDDSGIPVKYFGKQKWNLKFYGAYTKPIDLFGRRYQPELKKIYTSTRAVKPLNFGIGYNFKLNKSNLMLAIAGSKPQSKP
ncbi:MAG: hypothetical protein Fur006_64540 [Coleofasciculaceae cyanobacterium]